MSTNKNQICFQIKVTYLTKTVTTILKHLPFKFKESMSSQVIKFLKIIEVIIKMLQVKTKVVEITGLIKPFEMIANRLVENVLTRELVTKWP